MNSPKGYVDGLTDDASLGDAKGQEEAEPAPGYRPAFQGGPGRK